MKKLMVGLFSVALTASFVSAAPVVYNDAVNDVSGLIGLTVTSNHLDITSVSVDSDATFLYFTIMTDQNPITSPLDWGNYMIGIDSIVGGDTAGNGWARPITMSSGMDFWIGSWVNGGGGHQVWSYAGAVWTELPPAPTARPVTLNANSVSYIVPLADLGLTVGNTFTFDVFTSGGGGGDSAVDALSSATPSITTWGGPYNTGANGLSYTVVPEPSTLALLGGAGLLAFIRRFRRK